VVLTPLAVTDAAEMVHVLAARELYVHTGGEPPDRDGLQRRYERLVGGRSDDGAWAWHNWIVRLVADGRAIGTVQSTVSLSRPEAEIAWVVGVEWQGHGYATEAAGRIVGWLEGEGIVGIVARIHPAHGASNAVARHLGMRPTEVFVDGEREWWIRDPAAVQSAPMDSDLDRTTALLRRTPEVLRALLAGLSEAWTDTPDVAGGWRPRDVVGHLISTELEGWMPRARRILEDGTARAFDPIDRFAHVERDVGVPLDALVERFARLRSESLADLGRLAAPSDLDRRGLHPALGEVSLRELLASWAVHDLDHVAQVFAALAGSHDADVGPWKAYLGILLRRDDGGVAPG